ncbi:hypothetical protein, partial [Aeromonas caviae]|uniref:hypothetical protein n=1 Tax=Aeromonas caviae TaxID=648 RepID=UPI001CC5199C
MIVTMLGVTWKIRSWKTGKVPFRPLFVYKSQGLYWVPSSTDNVNKHIHRLTAFTDWLANKHGAEPMNP